MEALEGDDEPEPFYSAYGKISSRFGNDDSEQLAAEVRAPRAPNVFLAHLSLFLECRASERRDRAAHRGRHWTRRPVDRLGARQNRADRVPLPESLRGKFL